MKYIFTFFTFFSLSSSLFAQEAAPDFNRIADYDKKMDSLKKYCNVLMGSDSAKGDNFPQALIYGLKGLQMAKKEDHKSIAQFALVTGVSYYNRANFDSASYYFKLASKESAIAKNT